MKTSQEIIDMIVNVTDNFKLKTDLYGIRNKKTNKFIIMGLIENQLLYADSQNWVNLNLWNDIESAKTVYNIMSSDENFKENYFVDKLDDNEKENYCTENNILWR